MEGHELDNELIKGEVGGNIFYGEYYVLVEYDGPGDERGKVF